MEHLVWGGVLVEGWDGWTRWGQDVPFQEIGRVLLNRIFGQTRSSPVARAP